MVVIMLKGRKFAYAELCDNFYKRFRGLMFRKRLDKEGCLLFVLNRSSRIDASIHMMFVFFPIDVLWLDESFNVVDYKLNLKPFSLGSSPRKPAKYILEAAAGKCNSVRLGDKFEITGIGVRFRKYENKSL